MIQQGRYYCVQLLKQKRGLESPLKIQGIWRLRYLMNRTRVNAACGVSICSAPSQPVIKPLFWRKNRLQYNRDRRLMSNLVVCYPYIFTSGPRCYVTKGVLETNKKYFRFEPKRTETQSVSVVFQFVSRNPPKKNSVCFGVSNMYRNNQNKHTFFETNQKNL